MSVDISQQVLTTLYSLILGAALGVVYDVFRVLRLVGFKAKIIVFFQDVLFFAIATLSLFSFYMQFTDGKFRIYVFLFVVLGFVLYFLTVGRLLFFAIKKIYFFITSIFKWIYKKIVFPIFRTLFLPIITFLRKKYQKIVKFLKNLLPKLIKMLYNVLRVSKGKKGSARNAEREKNFGEKRFFC